MYRFYNNVFVFVGTYAECRMLQKVYGGLIRTRRF